MALHIETLFNTVLTTRATSACTVTIIKFNLSMEPSRRGENEKDRKNVMLLIYKINTLISDTIMIVKCNTILTYRRRFSVFFNDVLNLDTGVPLIGIFCR